MKKYSISKQFCAFGIILILLLLGLGLLWLDRLSFFYSPIYTIFNILIPLCALLSTIPIIYLAVAFITTLKRDKGINIVIPIVLVLLSVMLLVIWYSETENNVLVTITAPIVVETDPNNSIIIVRPSNEDILIHLFTTNVEVNLIEPGMVYGSLIYSYYNNDRTCGYLRYLFK